MRRGETTRSSPASADVFAIRVELVASSAADLLVMASILHGRGADISEAHLSKPSGCSRVFTATFTAPSARQADTVARTFQRRVGVLDVRLVTAPVDGQHQTT